jgi:LacI family transcriptional regulator
MPIRQPSSKQATLHDVAKLCGVSYQTVSRVVNNSPDVSNKTRRRVLEAIEALGYQPNLIARSLKTRQSLMLEVIIFGVDTYIPRELMESMGRAAKAHGYRLMFSSIVDDDVRGMQSLLHRLNSRACDGAIVTAPIEIDSYAKVLETHTAVPIVQVRNKRTAAVPSVTIDQHAGIQMATQYLLDLGHRQIAEISGPLSWYEASLRHSDFLAILNANGLAPAAIVESSQWMPSGGYAATHQLLDSGVSFSALIAANDYLGLGAILALTERGLRVPEDVSIVGFDDSPEAAFFRPPLTTIRQDYEALGQQSVQYLIDIIHNPDTPVHQRVLAPRLIERQSTCAVSL